MEINLSGSPSIPFVTSSIPAKEKQLEKNIETIIIDLIELLNKDVDLNDKKTLSGKQIVDLINKHYEFDRERFYELFQRSVNKDNKVNYDDVNINKAFDEFMQASRSLGVRKSLLDASRGRPVISQIKLDKLFESDVEQMNKYEIASQFEVDIGRGLYTLTTGNKTTALVNLNAIVSEVADKRLLTKAQFENYTRLVNQTTLAQVTKEILNTMLPNGQILQDVAAPSNVGKPKFNLQIEDDQVIIRALCDFRIGKIDQIDEKGNLELMGYIRTQTIISIPKNELNVLWEKENVKTSEVAPNMTVDIIKSDLLDKETYDKLKKEESESEKVTEIETETVEIEEFEDVQRSRRGAESPTELRPPEEELDTDDDIAPDFDEGFPEK